jgi:ABC-type antimicrobial peptide transport system permease subunit
MVFVEICDEQNTDCAKALTRLSAKLALNNSVSSANDWNSAYDVVKRNSGLIFGTPGLFSLQYVIAAISSIAACLVFLSLILSQRTKEMAIIQSIGGSRNQLGRLVIFEVMSVFITGLFLGGLLGFGLSLTFNGFFNVFGWLFQAAGLPGGSIITRELSWPISTLVSANGIIVICVSVSLTYALLKAISRDLVSALKED